MLTRFALRIIALASLTSLFAPAALAADRDRAVLAAVQKHLGIYSVVGAQRDPTEQVKVQQQGIEVWFMRPVPPSEREEAVCEGARWLLTGRMAISAGVGALFAERNELEQVTLVFYDLVTGVDRNRAGRYDQKRTPTPHARFTISRARAGQLDPKALEETLVGARCSAVAESVLDTLWTRN